jgi:hypothetical protein
MGRMEKLICQQAGYTYMARKQRLLVERIMMSVSAVIRFSLALAIAAAILNQRWFTLFASSATLILSFFPILLKRRFNIYLTTEFELIIVVFLYASLFLGEVHAYYTRFWWWDVVLHIGASLALGFIGFLLVYVLYRERKLQAKPLTIAILAFSFAVMIGTLWEIFEFAMDQSFGWNMQKSGLIDTMWDLIVDVGGALFTSVIGFLYIKGGKTFIFERILTRFVSRNPDIFGKD